MFWLHDSYHDEGGARAWRRRWLQALLALLTILAGAFICVGGLYVIIKAIVEVYQTGTVTAPFAC